jgi:starvation-inducible DNA-binding protein
MEDNAPYELSKEGLAKSLAEVLSDAVTLHYLAQGYHWNVRGPEFYQFHEFFGDIYEDIDSSIDPLAENIRKLGFDAPFTLEDFIALSCVDVKQTNSDPIAMSSVLYVNLLSVHEKYLYAFDLANSLNKQGIADFLAGRIDQNEKWAWQLGTTIGADATQVNTIQIMD